jgi:hypothetical protein
VGGRESPRIYAGVLNPELRVVAVAETEKEKDGSTSSSVDGKTWSAQVSLCGCSCGGSPVDWRAILLFFEEDVLNVSCLCSSGGACSNIGDGVAGLTVRQVNVCAGARVNG